MRVPFLKAFHIGIGNSFLIFSGIVFRDEAAIIITDFYFSVNKYKLVVLLNEELVRVNSLVTRRKREARSAWERYSLLNVAFNL